MRLRTNLRTYLLSSLFGISHQYGGEILACWIPFLAAKMRPFVSWINRHELERLPEAFRGIFRKCVGVLDCFELQVQKTSKRSDRQQMWSDYKARHTAKFLVAMGPTGVIMYVSKAYGGRMSDIEVVKKSPFFLKQLLRGDELLADRGFKMIEWFELNYGVYLRIPAFMDQGELPPGESHRTRKLAEARIHVERCIGRLRSFRILSETYPTRLYKMIDDVVTICAAICNQWPSIVPE